MNKQAYFKLMKQAFLGLFQSEPEAVTPQGQDSWDPNMIPFQKNSPYYFKGDKIDKTIQAELKKHYAKALAIAYKRATGKIFQILLNM